MLSLIQVLYIRVIWFLFSSRALDGIFQLLPPHTTSTVCVSYIEVYRDELRDLFVGVATEGGGVAGERGVTIREDSQGNIRKC